MKKATNLLTFIFISIFIFPACERVKSPAQLYDLKCEFQAHPLGIDRPQPLLQWKIQDDRRGAAQSAYQVIVSGNAKLLKKGKGDIWDSGKQVSGQSVHVKFNGSALESSKDYYWKVRIWDQDGNMSKWSESATWGMGLLNPGDWQAKWIARAGKDSLRSVYMRTEVELKNKAVEKARVYVTGLGNYQFFINGKKVGSDLFTPGWTQYPKRVEYQVYDIKDYLQEGKNGVGAVLGNMWWSSGLGWKGGARYSRGPLKLLAQIQIDYSDGSKDIFISDESWKWHNSPIVSDHIYHGEVYDSNLEEQGWSSPGFDDSAWAAVKPDDYGGLLSGPEAPALREQMQVIPVAINEPVDGEYVFDFGQNIVGWAKLHIKGDKGDTIKMRFAELLHNDGTVAQENLRSAKATDYVICNGNEIVWEPKFTYHGFRYVQVSGLKSAPDKSVLTGKVIYTNEPLIGSIECSNELINKIYTNVTWGQRGNFFAVPTDCPQRDERLGWMGDAQIFAPTANFYMNLDRYWTKWMFDIADGQDEEGWVYDVNPAIVVEGPAKPGWGDACIVIPWLTYRYFGDTRIIEENYKMMKAWVEYMRSESKDGIYIWTHGKPGWYGYGDWIAVEKSPSEPIGTAYYFYSTSLLGKMAAIIGKTEDAEQYAQLAGTIAAAFQKKYWDSTKMNYPGGTQTANLLPLAFGITPKNLQEQVVKNIVDDVVAHNVHPTTGFLGTGYILPILSKYGYQELAFKMITQKDYPSWGYMVEKGATTIWELWNSDSEKPGGMNSRNHFALGCIGEWVWNNIGGINICDGHPGFKRVVIEPKPVEGLAWAKAGYETNYGELTVDWKVDADVFTLNVTIPANSTAVIIPPVLKEGAILKEGGTEVASGNIPGISQTGCGNILVASGSYKFTLE